jgi:hypothetical protein
MGERTCEMGTTLAPLNTDLELRMVINNRGFFLYNVKQHVGRAKKLNYLAFSLTAVTNDPIELSE